MSSLAFIPEIEIYNILLGIFKFINLDYQAKIATPSDSILSKIFNLDRNGNQLNLGNFNWFEQAVELLINNDNDSPRKIEVSFGYNFERSGKPTIHIMMPNESPGESPIGMNEGYRDYEEIGANTHEVFTMKSSCSYNLLISSDNSSEVILIYTFLRAMFVSIKQQMELLEYYNITFGGSDVMFDSEFAPPNIYHRNFIMNFSFSHDGINLFGVPKISNINITGNLTQ